MTYRCRVLWGVVGAMAVAAPALAVNFGDAWDWRLAPRRFGKLSQAERVQYGRAEDLFGKRQYEAAAVEFEKFTVQNPNSPVRSHPLLLRAYSLHLARQKQEGRRCDSRPNHQCCDLWSGLDAPPFSLKVNDLSVPRTRCASTGIVCALAQRLHPERKFLRFLEVA